MTSTPLPFDSGPHAVAMAYAQQSPMTSGYLRVIDHARKPFTQHFVFGKRWVNRVASPRLEAISINGLCPWCGIIFVAEELWRCIAPNPQAGMIVAQSRWKGEAVVAEFGLTFACEHCQRVNRLGRLSSVTSQVTESAWYGLETTKSNRFRQFRFIPPLFRWERDAGQYVSINREDPVPHVSDSLWEPI